MSDRSAAQRYLSKKGKERKPRLKTIEYVKHLLVAEFGLIGLHDAASAPDKVIEALNRASKALEQPYRYSFGKETSRTLSAARETTTGDLCREQTGR